MRAATDSALRQALQGSLALLSDIQALSAQGSGVGREGGSVPRAPLRYGAVARRAISGRAAALEPFVQDRCVWGQTCRTLVCGRLRILQAQQAQHAQLDSCRGSACRWEGSGISLPLESQAAVWRSVRISVAVIGGKGDPHKES